MKQWQDKETGGGNVTSMNAKCHKTSKNKNEQTEQVTTDKET